MLRLFRRGDREEYVFVDMLRKLGATVYDVDDNGKQFEFEDLGGHLSGHTDGVVELPDRYWRGADNRGATLLEFKTYNTARFKKLCTKKLCISDPKYYAQVQLYMGYGELEYCLFMAVCKETDELYLECVKFLKVDFLSYVKKAQYIIEAVDPPARISTLPSWWECKFCKHKCVCHSHHDSKVSCRSCYFARPIEGKKWMCIKGNDYGKVCDFYKDIASQ
jgi:hypothetical protein